MMQFPLNAAVRSNANDVPKPVKPQNFIGIFDNHGYWARFNGSETIEFPGDQLALGLQIAALANAAYEQGRADQAEQMRDVLNYGADRK